MELKNLQIEKLTKKETFEALQGITSLFNQEKDHRKAIKLIQLKIKCLDRLVALNHENKEEIYIPSKS